LETSEKYWGPLLNDVFFRTLLEHVYDKNAMPFCRPGLKKVQLKPACSKFREIFAKTEGGKNHVWKKEPSKHHG